MIRMPEEPREFPIVNGKYDDAEDSVLPSFDEGCYEEDSWNEDQGE